MKRSEIKSILFGFASAFKDRVNWESFDPIKIQVMAD